MPSLRPLLSVTLLLASVSSAIAASCDKVYDEQGNEYDLSPLAGSMWFRFLSFMAQSETKNSFLEDYIVEGHNLNGKMYIG
jgi:hypothetical protein